MELPQEGDSSGLGYPDIRGDSQKCDVSTILLFFPFWQFVSNLLRFWLECRSLSLLHFTFLGRVTDETEIFLVEFPTSID